MSKKIIMATLGFVFIMSIAAQVVAVNRPDNPISWQTSIKNSFRG